jgi:hypothetical protein
MYNLAQFRMLRTGGGSPYCLQQMHLGIHQAFAHYSLTDHTGGAK